jgi:hypothetical protein
MTATGFNTAFHAENPDPDASERRTPRAAGAIVAVSHGKRLGGSANSR